jgi:hypothetical protein
MNEWRLQKTNMSVAYCIVPSNAPDDVAARYVPYYARVQAVAKINTKRGGKLCRYFTVYRLEGWKSPVLRIEAEKEKSSD